MAKYAKNYLPILFNIYTTEMNLEKDPIRQSIVDTIKCYLKIADSELCNTYLNQSIANFKKYDELDEKPAQTIGNSNNNQQADEKKLKSNKVVFDSEKVLQNIRCHSHVRQSIIIHIVE